VVPKVQAGATVADVGCGHGASTVAMAQAFPASRFIGIDYHAPSIATAAERAREAGLAGRVTFLQATAKSYSGHDYELICFFDCLHDMGDPIGAARHARQALKLDDTVLLVEPYRGGQEARPSASKGRWQKEFWLAAVFTLISRWPSAAIAGRGRILR
jgi:2-polyprenyl-3-methyl-5-hydroxy-6-metoxy-1,4-benzoquinol methylase